MPKKIDKKNNTDQNDSGSNDTNTKYSKHTSDKPKVSVLITITLILS